MEMKNRIALGTAQFGFDYGINNQRGQVPREEVFKILEAAFNVGIDTIDTASMYGQSEEVLGEFLKTHNKKFKIVSKAGNIPASEIKSSLVSSLEKLGMDSFYGYLIHNFQHYQKAPEIWQELYNLKLAGMIKKIGFSVYSPQELEILLQKDVAMDMIQIPYSIFDRRFESYFVLLKSKGIKIYARSVFTQGVVFINPKDFEGALVNLKEKVQNLALLSNRENIPILSLCLNFVLLNQFIDKIIVGVDSLENFLGIYRAMDDFQKIKTKGFVFSSFQEEGMDVIYRYLIDVYKLRLGIISKELE